jgi:hypothetical protein
VQVPQLVLNDTLTPVTPELDGDVKVFRMTIDEITVKVDEKMPPIPGLGYNGAWPGPTIRVNQGDKVRAEFTNNLNETTGIHFHGVEFEDFFMDGVPFVTQKPIIPGETFAYEFTASNAGSLMYHSHHNATDQVGRGLLGPFLVDPKPEPVAYDREYVWISNDQLGGFTINGHGFPAVVPVLAAAGEKVRVRFMNEGIMMHPWHLHGMPMRVIERDGWPLGSAEFTCDTLGVNPGERFDVIIDADTWGLGVPLPHPAARRGRRQDVRHGEHADRGARGGPRPTRPIVGAARLASAQRRHRRPQRLAGRRVRRTTALGRSSIVPAMRNDSVRRASGARSFADRTTGFDPEGTDGWRVACAIPLRAPGGGRRTVLREDPPPGGSPPEPGGPTRSPRAAGDGIARSQGRCSAHVDRRGVSAHDAVGYSLVAAADESTQPRLRSTPLCQRAIPARRVATSIEGSQRRSARSIARSSSRSRQNPTARPAA